VTQTKRQHASANAYKRYIERMHQHFEIERRVAAEDASDGDEEANGEIQESLLLGNPTAGLQRETYAGLSRRKSARDKPFGRLFLEDR
jgi:hypothetical protein